MFERTPPKTSKIVRILRAFARSGLSAFADGDSRFPLWPDVLELWGFNALQALWLAGIQSRWTDTGCNVGGTQPRGDDIACRPLLRRVALSRVGRMRRDDASLDHYDGDPAVFVPETERVFQ